MKAGRYGICSNGVVVAVWEGVKNSISGGVSARQSQWRLITTSSAHREIEVVTVNDCISLSDIENIK